jgi:hypothetical protein
VLIVIDSIAGPFRIGDFGPDDALRRSADLYTIASALKRLAATCAIFVSNQVADVMDGGSEIDDAQGAIMATAEGPARAALGLSWSSCVTTRLLVDRVLDGEGGMRTLSVMRGPAVAPVSAMFCIGGGGVEAVGVPGGV